MARERYLLNADEEDTIHSNVIELKTAKDKRKNWWYYNRKKVFVSFLLLITVVYFIISVFFKTQPDYRIALLNQIIIEEDALDILERQIEQYGVDLNGDGKVVVEVMNYSAGAGSEGNAYYAQSLQATYVKFSADITAGDSMIWLHDKAGYAMLGEEPEGIFEPLPVENTLEEDDTMMDINEVPGLIGADYSGYQGMVFDGETVQKLMSTLRVSIRMPEGSTIEKSEKLMQYYADSVELFHNLVNDTKPAQTAPETE